MSTVIFSDDQFQKALEELEIPNVEGYELFVEYPGIKVFRKFIEVTVFKINYLFKFQVIFLISSSILRDSIFQLHEFNVSTLLGIIIIRIQGHWKTCSERGTFCEGVFGFGVSQKMGYLR